MTNAESKKIQPIWNNEESSKHPLEHLVIRHGSLFSGIGGFDLAAQWTGWENVFQVEIDDYCTKVLEKNFPNAKRYRDIREFDGTQYRGTIDVVSGGFPCQPFSHAGKRKGKEDERYLWEEMLRAIREIQPAWIVGENVSGLLTMQNGVVFEQMCVDLEKEDYEVQPFIIPACAKDAPHRRDRVWIIAHASEPRTRSNNGKIGDEGRRTGEGGGESIRQTHGKISTGGISPTGSNAGNAENNAFNKIGKVQKRKNTNTGGGNEVDSYSESSKRECTRRTRARGKRFTNDNIAFANTESREAKPTEQRGFYAEPCIPSWRENWTEVASKFCGVDDGLSNRTHRLRSLGNAIVPQVAFEIFRAIAAVSV